MPSITRTIKIEDIEPSEVADLFCEFDGQQQADFFEHIGFVAKSWPGAGWCQQSYDIALNLNAIGRETITKLAEHVLGFDDMLTALHQYRNDMLFPPAADSRERRIAMIDAAITKATSV